MMPLLPQSTYRKPPVLFNRHIETIYPGLIRRVRDVPAYERERIDTPDGDFLDLDWIIKGAHRKLVVLSHGLEGDSGRPYMKGMARAFARQGWDVLAWSYRGCSGEMNRKRIFYHSGASYDLEHVVAHAAAKGYEHLALVGFSLGGNLSLKYLGESRSSKAANLLAAVAFSVPLDLAACAREIDLPHNVLYSRRFLRSLKKKIKDKNGLMPGLFDVSQLEQLDSIYAFDDHMTAPIHGFKNADHYYASCSSVHFLDSIKIPTLVVNAQNDPFLSDSCLRNTPFESLEQVFFEKPENGGHVGFSACNSDNLFWSERRALEFVNEQLEKA